MKKQRKDRLLAVRRETAQVLADAVSGKRQSTHIEASQLSRYTTDTNTNPLAHIVLLIRDLPEERAAMLLAAVEDAYADAHGNRTGGLTLTDAWLDMDAADSAQDNARMSCAVDGATDEELRDFIATSRQQDRTNEVARMLATRELHRRMGEGPIRPAPSWRHMERRTA